MSNSRLHLAASFPQVLYDSSRTLAVSVDELFSSFPDCASRAGCMAEAQAALIQQAPAAYSYHSNEVHSQLRCQLRRHSEADRGCFDRIKLSSVVQLTSDGQSLFLFVRGGEQKSSVRLANE